MDNFERRHTINPDIPLIFSIALIAALVLHGTFAEKQIWQIVQEKSKSQPTLQIGTHTPNHVHCLIYQNTQTVHSGR